MSISASRLVDLVREVANAFSRSHVSHAVAGGVAVAAHGHQRATKDIDLLIDATHAQQADTALRALGFTPKFRDDGAGFIRYRRRPLPSVPELVEWVDLLLARRAVDRDMLECAARHPAHWHGIELPIVSVEGVVLMKLLSSIADPSRAYDRIDIVALLRANIDAFDYAWVENAGSAFGPEFVQTFRELAAAANAPLTPLRPTGL